MSKCVETSEELTQLFTKIWNQTSIPQWVEFKLLSNSTLKKPCKVKKLTDDIEKISDGCNILVTFNEDFFDKITEEEKTILIDEVLSGLSVNDSDRILYQPNTIETNIDTLKKHTEGVVIPLKESFHHFLKQKEEQEKEEKLRARELKKSLKKK